MLSQSERICSFSCYEIRYQNPIIVKTIVLNKKKFKINKKKKLTKIFCLYRIHIKKRKKKKKKKKTVGPITNCTIWRLLVQTNIIKLTIGRAYFSCIELLQLLSLQLQRICDKTRVRRPNLFDKYQLGRCFEALDALPLTVVFQLELQASQHLGTLVQHLFQLGNLFVDCLLTF